MEKDAHLLLSLAKEINKSQKEAKIDGFIDLHITALDELLAVKSKKELLRIYKDLHEEGNYLEKFTRCAMADFNTETVHVLAEDLYIEIDMRELAVQLVMAIAHNLPRHIEPLLENEMQLIESYLCCVEDKSFVTLHELYLEGYKSLDEIFEHIK